MPKRAMHYVAWCKGSNPVLFYVENGLPAAAAASAFARWARVDHMVLWPTDARGVYNAKWFDPRAETFRETRLTIIEEK